MKMIWDLGAVLGGFSLAYSVIADPTDMFMRAVLFTFLITTSLIRALDLIEERWG